MKKLLAMILCVMMFVSILSTTAFAAYDHEDQRVWRGKGQISDIIDALKTNTNLMYGSIAADTAVYQSVKAIDDMMKDLVDKMIEGYAPTTAGTTQPGNVISDAVIAGLRSTIGGEISDYLTQLMLCRRHEVGFFCPESFLIEEDFIESQKGPAEERVRALKVQDMSSRIRVEMVYSSHHYLPGYAIAFKDMLKEQYQTRVDEIRRRYEEIVSEDA